MDFFFFSQDIYNYKLRKFKQKPINISLNTVKHVYTQKKTKNHYEAL